MPNGGTSAGRLCCEGLLAEALQSVKEIEITAMPVGVNFHSEILRADYLPAPPEPPLVWNMHLPIHLYLRTLGATWAAACARSHMCRHNAVDDMPHDDTLDVPDLDAMHEPVQEKRS